MVPVPAFLLIVSLLPLTACQQPTGAPTPSVAEPAATAGDLVRVEPMSRPRAAHSATTLSDGRVLLAGGLTDAPDAATGAELFDPDSGAFTSAGPMQVYRHSHSATRLADGRVLLVGGYDTRGRYLASAEIYDPAANAFTPVEPLQTARADHVAVTLEDGRVLIVGGAGEGWTFLASVEVFDPETGSFAPTGTMARPRESHAAVRLADGRVLVVGGHRGRRQALELYTSAEIYDPATGDFTPTGDLHTRRHKHDAVLLPDGRVLVTGGTDERDYSGRYTSVEVYDPATGAFESARAMRVPRYKHRGTSIVLADGRVLLAGGASEAEIYDPESGTSVRVGGEALMPGQFSATALLPDGRVLVTGGYGEGRGAQPSAWLFYP